MIDFHDGDEEANELHSDAPVRGDVAGTSGSGGASRISVRSFTSTTFSRTRPSTEYLRENRAHCSDPTRTYDIVWRVRAARDALAWAMSSLHERIVAVHGGDRGGHPSREHLRVDLHALRPNGSWGARHYASVARRAASPVSFYPGHRAVSRLLPTTGLLQWFLAVVVVHALRAQSCRVVTTT